MTDEEREKLCEWLRDMQHTYGQSWQYGAIADEIERLITEVRQLERDLQWTRERYAMAEYSKL